MDSAIDLAAQRGLESRAPGGIESVLGALGLGLSVLLDLLAAQSLVFGGRVTVLMLHLMSAGLLAAALPSLLPPKSCRPRLQSRLALLLISLFIPVLGPLGLAGGLLWSLHGRRPPERDPYLYVRPPRLPLRPLFMGEGAPLRFSEGALALVLKNAPDPDKRVAAVMALRRMAQENATPLLRIALRDPVDDVRLLAYAMTDGIDKEINRRIQRRLVALSSASRIGQARLRKALAQDYWDIAFLGLASSDVEAHVLSEAARHLERVLDVRPDGGAALLLGRIRLRQGRATEAEVAFARARALGLPSIAVSPYRAEAAFQLRRFDDVRARLAELPPTSRTRITLAEVLHFWLTPGEEPG